MRQYIALSILLVGFLYIEKNKYVYIASIALAILFHSTAIIGLLFFLFKYLSMQNKFLVSILLLISFVVGFFLFDKLLPLIYYIQGYLGNKAIYLDTWGGERNLMANLVTNILFYMTYILSKDKSNVSLKMFFCFVLLNNLFGSAGQGNRIFLYLQIAMLICIPNVYKETLKYIPKYTYLLIVLVYSFCKYVFTIERNISDVIPYVFR